MAEEKKKQASKSKATAEKKPAAKKTATSAKKETAAKKTATAAKKETTAKKTSTAAKKETTAKKTATAAKKETAAKKTSTAEKKETTAKKTATSVKKETAAKKTATAAKKETVAEKVETTAKKETAAKKTAEVAKKAAKPTKKENEKVNLSKTTFVKAGKTSKKWIILDAAGKPLGRVAALAASMLRGKHKVDFTPNVDCGDSVIIINCKDVVLTGKKLEQKVRYHHSGWIGGIKETKYSELMKKEPQKAMTMAVEGMLPHNSLGAKMARHLRTYKDENHGHEAQKPEVFEFKV